MKKHRNKIFAGVVTCLIFLFVLSSLFGCKFAFLKGDPEFKIVKLQMAEEVYNVKIPFFMPDFTKFGEPDTSFYNAVLVGLNYNIPDSKLDSHGYVDHYRFICSNDMEDIPGVLAVCSFIGDEYRYWLYNEKNEPYEVDIIQMSVFLENWVAEKYQQMDERFEEEMRKNESI